MTEGEKVYQDGTRSLESLDEIRLRALLGDMVDGMGPVKAAEALGVSYRSLVRARESGRLTSPMAHALEAHLLLGGGSAPARQRELVEGLARALESGLARLRGEVNALREELLGAVENVEAGLREEYGRGLRRLERRVAQLEAERVVQSQAEEQHVRAVTSALKQAWRPYPDLVTLEAEPGEERVYGDAAPVIVEWRDVRARYLVARDGLAKAEVEERLLELELELVGKHEMTLPPSTYPWDWSGRRDEEWKQTGRLEMVRARLVGMRFRRRLRRVLTLGRWRG